MLEHRLGQLLGCHEPTRLEGSLVQFQQPLYEVGIVLQVAVELGFPGLPRPQQTIIPLSQLTEEEISVALGNLPVACGERTRTVIAIQSPCRLGKSGEHQPVPRGEDLGNAHGLAVQFRRTPKLLVVGASANVRRRIWDALAARERQRAWPTGRGSLNLSRKRPLWIK